MWDSTCTGAVFGAVCVLVGCFIGQVLFVLGVFDRWIYPGRKRKH